MKHSIILFILLSVVIAARASADPAVVVLGPAGDAKLAAPRLKLVETALVKAAVGKPGGRAIDTTCVADTLCLQGHGATLGAVRLLAVAAAPGKGTSIDLTFVLVDVQGKELIAKRDVNISDAKVGRQLAGELAKFLDEGPTTRAKALFDQGNQHYNLGDFAKALDVYKRAYRAKALPAFLFNIAQCHRKLEQHKEAVAMYQSYLVGVPDAPNKTLVESLITESKGKLTDEQRRIDESERAKNEAKNLELARKKAEEDRKAKEISERGKVEQAKIAVARERELDKTYNRHPVRKWAFVLGGLGVATAAAGGYFAFKARSSQSAFDDAGCGDGSPLDERALAQCRADRDDGDKAAGLANILLASGGAVVLGSLIVYAIDPGNIERPSQSRAAVTVSPGGVKVTIRW